MDDPMTFLSMFDSSSVVLVVVIVFLAITLILGVRIVPQSEQYVVTRLGKYHRTLAAGVNLIVPYLDQVHSKISIADQVVNDVRLDVVSRDNVVFSIELLCVYRVVKSEYAVFRVSDVSELVIGLIKSLVRSEIGKVELDAIQQERDSLNVEIRQALEAAADDYGINISRAEITDVELKPETQRAMAEVLEAERMRRAAILRAEGEKRAVELAADATLYKQQKEAEALMVTANATAESNRLIRDGMAEGGEAAARFQIAERQIEAFQKLAASSNSKIIVLPGDATDGFTRAATILAKD
ncbi:SPFH domain-containing protein [uncultured Albimonas sp.]|uniref:SPFH domain-containing protein n=1 Tax=uncultured Albimonas sp. TaxID=1331701 RepID=UPI0030EDEBE8